MTTTGSDWHALQIPDGFDHAAGQMLSRTVVDRHGRCSVHYELRGGPNSVRNTLFHALQFQADDLHRSPPYFDSTGKSLYSYRVRGDTLGVPVTARDWSQLACRVWHLEYLLICFGRQGIYFDTVDLSRLIVPYDAPGKVAFDLYQMWEFVSRNGQQKFPIAEYVQRIVKTAREQFLTVCMPPMGE